MNKSKWQKLALIILISLSSITYADPYTEATADRQPVVDLSYFGTHFHRLVLSNDEINKGYQTTEWPPQLFGSIRLWDSGVRWADLAPSRGRWNFSRMDTYINQATINNVTVMYTLGSTPQWASARPLEECPYGLGCSAEPANMSDWEDYVRVVSKRYRGKIAVYELWNEPFFSDVPRVRGQASFYRGSLAKMEEMARVARMVLDQEDPKAQLSTPGFDDSVEQLENFLAAGGKEYVQAVDFHFYSSDSKAMADKLIKVRRVMQKQGVANLPLLNTETGVLALSPYNSSQLQLAAVSQAEGAAKIAQYLILGAAGGVQQFYQYAWDNPSMGMMTPTGQKLPAYNAYIKTRFWLLHSKMLGCVGMLPDGVMCQGEKVGHKFIYAWAIKPGAYSLPLPNGFSVASAEKLKDTVPEMLTRNSNVFILDSSPIRIQLKQEQRQ